MNGHQVKLYLFYCVNSADIKDLLQKVGCNGDELKAIPMPCSGKIDILYLTKAFESGADGVAVITCKYGECQYLEGNLRATKRVRAVDTLIDEIGLGEGRMLVIQVAESGMAEVVKEITDFREVIKAKPRKSFVEDESELEKE